MIVQQRETGSLKREKSTGRMFTAFVSALVFSPLLALLFCEVYDHVPGRSWIYRQTHTIFFVDVTAQMEVDGENLTLTRTIRCIEQPKPWSLEPGTREERSVFDALGAISKSGRMIVVNVPAACSFLDPDVPWRREDLRKNGIIYDASMQQVSQPVVNRNPPLVREVIGSRQSLDKIHSYSPKALVSNHYGIRLNELKIVPSQQTFQLFDGNAYDWIGLLGWYGRGATLHYGYFGYELPSDFLEAIDPALRNEIETCSRPCAISLTYKFAAHMMVHYNLHQLEKFPIDFDESEQMFRLRPDNPGRLNYVDLPIGTNLGRRDNNGPYISYLLGDEEVKAYQVGNFRNFIFPGSDFVLVMRDGRLFYLPESAEAVTLRR